MLKELFVHRTNHGLIQMIRYGMVVAIAAPIDLGGYIILKASFHVYYVLAATLSFTLSLIANYFLSIAWVWTAKTGHQRHIDAVIFGIIGLVGLALTDLIVWAFTDFVNLNYIASKLVAFVFVFFWSFGARRYLFQRQLSEANPVTE
ncbi:MAG TPA: GtrA family protein [Candidatus Saccharimonadales bacterium]|nr:GtrA family protein [Candidatus Saccharimonadales bacterium]